MSTEGKAENTPIVHIAPDAAKKLSDDPRARAALAKKNPKFGELGSAHSVGTDHKPHQQSGKQAKAEKKVRW